MRLVVIGQGYVGLPVSMRAVEAGHDVVGLTDHSDVDYGTMADLGVRVFDTRNVVQSARNVDAL